MISFFFSEVVSILSVSLKEVLRMIIRFLREVKSFVNNLLWDVIIPLEVYHPYRFNLLMIW